MGSDQTLNNESNAETGLSAQQRPKKKNPEFGYDSLESVRKKLLDLTGRNQLINYKHPKGSSVRIIDELPDQICEELQAGNSFVFIPVPEPTEEQLIAEGYLCWNEEGELVATKPFPTAERWAQFLGLNISYELPEPTENVDGKHRDLNIQTLMYSRELEARLRSIRGIAESAVEESGSNVLYLVLGFIEWYESRDSDINHIAPLFTLPVKLERTKLDVEQGVFRYVINLKDEGLLSNITLREKLANDFDLALPAIDDDSTPEAYFCLLQDTVLKHEPRWKLRRMATLAILNFSKQAMYEDLNPANWPQKNRIEDHPIVKMFFSSQDEEAQSADRGFVGEYTIDQIFDVHEQYPLIFEADSSQHSALIDAARGENLVIEGPPGSGKSQTITNIIAACIANGKRVLFVAEKMAALEVVKQRLDRAGLGDFCLELHSHKTQKQRLLEDLNHRLNKQGKYPNPREIDADIARFEDLKEKLNHYVEVINSEWKNTGLSIHEIFNRATRYRERLGLNPENYLIEGVSGETLTAVRRRALLDMGDLLKNIYYQIQDQAPGAAIENHYWFGVSNAGLMGYHLEPLVKSLRDWDEQLSQLQAECQKVLELYVVPRELLSEISQVDGISDAGAKLPELLGGEPIALVRQWKGSSEKLAHVLDQYESLYTTLDGFDGELTQAAIGATKAPAVILQSIKKLKSLGTLEAVTLADIQCDYDEVKQADSLVKSFDNQLKRIRERLPENIKDMTNGNVEALNELKIFVGFTFDLPPELWQYRDSIYDAPEMDDLLRQLTSRFGSLVPIHKELQPHFKLYALPSAQVLRGLGELLTNSGVFSFLSKEWREAKKVCYEISSSRKPDKKLLYGLLPKLVEYKQGLEEVDRLNEENRSLNILYKGIDTPLSRIASVRSWYRSVRQEYGRGLSPRAKYAEALFGLDRDLGCALSDLANGGFLEKIENILEVRSKFAKHYSGVHELADTSLSLLSDQSPLGILLGALHKPLKNLMQCFERDGQALMNCQSIAIKLREFQVALPRWQQDELVKLLASSGLSMEIAPGRKSPEVLAIARNFLNIVCAADQCPAIGVALARCKSVHEYEELKGCVANIEEMLQRVLLSWELFSELGRVNQQEWFQSSRGVLEDLLARNQQALNNVAWLSNWLEYLSLRQKIKSEGMHKLSCAVENGELRTDTLVDTLSLVLMHQLSKEVLTEMPFFAEFSGMEQVAVRDRFCEYDKKLLALQREKIAYRAAQVEAPLGNASGKVSTYTEVSLIRHEAGKKRAHIAVRRLIDRAGRAIQALKPCFMMSPMSVAQYVKPGKFGFDIVVMDEASQIRPEDALGAIARGKSLIVVGDPKQLPPTSFFDKMINEELDDDSVALEESESILESAMPIFRTRRLRWHYRSRHESLIAFSNLHYYNSDLVIFPSPYASGSDFGLHYRKVNRGRFSRGKNAEEARCIAQDALRQLLERPDESVGLVAMNAEQRTEIEMHVEQLVKENSQFKLAFDKNQETDEPLFIKNLENVQGDERDVIMISMTYGPDDVGGKVYQRFGPINRDVGWRRLNVLFTRSKKRMHIFSSMDARDIQVTERSRKGVQSLRKFLEYCESGHLVSAEISGRGADSDFEVAVSDALGEHGYECEPQLGVAGYYLDLAVKDPDYSGCYLMGVECDGVTYHSAKSARDRDRLRQEILESLGWRIRRIWSTDWFKNPQAQLQPILNELNRLISGREKRVVSDESALPEKVGAGEDLLVVEEEYEVAMDPEDKSLRDILIEFEESTIRTRFPGTPSNNQLLRPAMLEALLNELPTSKEEFAFKIPGYLRTATDVAEAQNFLDDVLEIIGDYG